MAGADTPLCPWCSEPLEAGTFRSRGGNYFLPEGERTPLLYTKSSMNKRRAVPVEPFLFASALPASGASPEAYVCRRCHKIIIPYS